MAAFRLPRLSRKKARVQPGLPPGTLLSRQSGIAPSIKAVGYSEEDIRSIETTDIEKAAELGEEFPNLWLNINGTDDVEFFKRLGEKYNIHHLVLEDILNGNQTAKIENYESYLFITVRVPLSKNPSETEQVSILFFPSLVISVQEGEHDDLTMLRKRLDRVPSRIRSIGSEYFTYAIIDLLVDSWTHYLQVFEDRLDDQEEALLVNADNVMPEDMHQMKSMLLMTRRSLRPLRDSLKMWLADDLIPISKDTAIYLRDTLDHVENALDTADSHREVITGLTDLQLATSSTRMNEVMQVLTVIATMFIPLTFLVGIYGMNFNAEVSAWNMPELDWKYGYLAIWILMIGLIVGQLLFFRHKGWLRVKRRDRNRKNRKSFFELFHIDVNKTQSPTQQHPNNEKKG
ncbi:magnesium/cobalt transporter CorA [bacterium]|nr:magnesium/cobalt transporter CorA [bacterium]